MEEAAETFTLDLSYFRKLKEYATCQKCDDILEDPVQLTICEHLFCAACLYTKRCPKCRLKYADDDVKPADIFTDRIVHLVRQHDAAFAAKNYRLDGIPVNVFETMVTSRRSVRNDGEEQEGSVCTRVEWDRGGVYKCPEICKTRLIKRVECNTKRNPKGETPLHTACRRGNCVKVLELIGKGVDLNTTDWANWTPLHEAVIKGSETCVQALLSKGALVDVYGENYTTPLHRAVSLENEEIARMLLKYGADKNAEDYTGLSVMDIEMNASMAHILETTERLPELPGQYLYHERETHVLMLGVANASMCKLFNDVYTFTKNPQLKHIDFCMIGSGVQLSQVEVLKCLAKGIMIIREYDLCDYLNGKVPYAPSFIPFKIRSGLVRSIRCHLEKKPGLFDGINFHVFGHQKAVRVDGSPYTKADLESLIKCAGGKVLVRPPSEQIADEQPFRPYHSKGCKALRQCCNFIVYDEHEPPLLLYGMAQLKHVSSEWVVKCVTNYKISNI